MTSSTKCTWLYSGDVSELYPISRIEQEVRGEKDIYGPGSLQDTYYQVGNSLAQFYSYYTEFSNIANLGCSWILLVCACVHLSQEFADLSRT